MSTQTITQGTVLVVEDSDTQITSNETSPEVAALPEINDGSGTTVSVGDEIRFDAAGGGAIRIETADGRLVGVVPGYGEAVVVAERGAAESETDFWRFRMLANSPSAYQSIGASYTQAEIQALRDCLVDQGLMEAE